MSISYLCPKCQELLKIDGFHATNEIGRKYCSHCGSNQNNLACVDLDQYKMACIAIQTEPQEGENPMNGDGEDHGRDGPQDQDPVKEQVADMLQVISACMALMGGAVPVDHLSSMSVREFLTLCARNKVEITISAEGAYTL